MAEDLFKLEEQRYNFTRMLGEAKAKMDSSKVGSAAYKAAKKNYDTAKAALPGIESKIKKIKADSEKAKSEKKTSDKLTKLQEGIRHGTGPQRQEHSCVLRAHVSWRKAGARLEYPNGVPRPVALPADRD